MGKTKKPDVETDDNNYNVLSSVRLTAASSVPSSSSTTTYSSPPTSCSTSSSMTRSLSNAPSDHSLPHIKHSSVSPSVSAKKENIQGKVPRGFQYPRTCPLCKKTYESKNSYSGHKKKCGLSKGTKAIPINKSKQSVSDSNLATASSPPSTKGLVLHNIPSDHSFPGRKVPIVSGYVSDSKTNIESGGAGRCRYPRTCPKCNKSYQTKSSFSGHKTRCGLSKNRKTTKTPRISKSKKSTSPALSSDRPSSDEKLSRDSSPVTVKKCGAPKLFQYPRMCPDCNSSYQNRHSFFKHKKTCGLSKKSKTVCIYEDCSMVFYLRTMMIRHLKYDHNVDIDVICKEFDDFEEFEAWKEEEEATKFTKFSASTRKQCKGLEHRYFTCHFDVEGKTHRRSDESFRLSNRQWKKGRTPNSNCPARMLVSTNSKGKVTVEYVATHNHPLTFENTKYQQMPRSVLSFIKSRIAMGVSNKTIKKELQGDAGDGDEMIEGAFPFKENFVSMRYLDNVKASMRRSYTPVKKPNAPVQAVTESEEPQEIFTSQTVEFIAADDDDDNEDFNKEESAEECLQIIDDLRTMITDSSINPLMIYNVKNALKPLVAQCQEIASTNVEPTSVAHSVVVAPNQKLVQQTRTLVTVGKPLAIPVYKPNVVAQKNIKVALVRLTTPNPLSYTQL